MVDSLKKGMETPLEECVAEKDVSWQQQMYSIVYDKQTIKDIKKLKSAQLAIKAKKLIEIVRHNPFANPPLRTDQNCAK